MKIPESWKDAIVHKRKRHEFGEPLLGRIECTRERNLSRANCLKNWQTRIHTSLIRRTCRSLPSDPLLRWCYFSILLKASVSAGRSFSILSFLSSPVNDVNLAFAARALIKVCFLSSSRHLFPFSTSCKEEYPHHARRNIHTMQGRTQD